jgi:hypothetical protein
VKKLILVLQNTGTSGHWNLLFHSTYIKSISAKYKEECIISNMNYVDMIIEESLEDI